MAFGDLTYIAHLKRVEGNGLGAAVVEKMIRFEAPSRKSAKHHAERLAKLERMSTHNLYLADHPPQWVDLSDVIEPDPDCYGCLGTGAIKGFGHDGKRCLCLDMEDAA